jgi:D-erythro-7,8-dihydroneopterin triphosphate epimerase
MIIRIKNLRLRTVVGYNDWETQKKQDVVINVEMEFDASRAVETDDIEETVNYREVKREIIETIENGRFRLLESVADRILRIVMENRRVERASVEVDKPHALRFADSVSAFSSAERR